MSNNVIPKNILADVVLCVSRSMREKKVFEEYDHHYNDLLKKIINCYCKIRLHNIAKKYSLDLHDDFVRPNFNKLVLFKHQ